MAIKTKATSTPATISYVDFEPACDLLKEEDLETLVIHLPEFKKEQLRVQVNKDGVLKVSGERPTSPDGTKKSRFVKETKIAEGCDINDIRAKFINNRLNVTMPIKKVATPPPSQVIQEQPASTSSPPPQPEDTDKKPKAEATTMTDDKTPKGTSTENGKMSDTSCYYEPKGDRKTFEQGRITSIMQRLQERQTKVVLGFGIAAVTMVAIGAFVASKFGSETATSSASLFNEDSGLM